jgi:Fibrinogen beta and gamma chains, C-terminal globular domain
MVGHFSAKVRFFGFVCGACALTACGFSTLDGLSGGPDDAAAGADVVDARPDRGRGAGGGGGSFDATPDAARAIDAPAETDVTAQDVVASSCDGGCPGNGYCADGDCAYPSCIARLLSQPRSPSGVYLVDPDGAGGEPPFRAFCEMVLDGGGWTLLLKVDGTRTTFVHDAAIWEEATTLHPESPDLDLTEAKLGGYATMPFVYVRVGMVQNQATHWLILPLEGESLAALMKSGYHATNVGRSAWERLPARGSLQANCNREGINVDTPQAGARIGIVSNNQNDCSTCNSVIGLGAEGNSTGDVVCGNVAATSPDNGDRNDVLFGYVMVR